LFENVKAGDIIAVEHPAIPSINGQTVTGKIIPTARLNTVAAKAGAGIEFISGRLEYAAKMNGRVMYKDTVLSITEEFVVDEDVDYKTGHINFVGVVHVRGDVLDGFNVNGKKGVKIYNNIGNSCIESEGDIDIGGMTGRDAQAKIRCHGRLKAGYLYNVDVECAGNIYVKREIMHSNIKSNGAVFCQGRIVGGNCLALAGIETATTGSEFGIKTFLNAGIDFHLANAIHVFIGQLKTVQKRLQELNQQLDQYLTPPQNQTTSLSEKQRLQLQESIQKISDQKKQILQKLDWIYSNMSQQANPKINVYKELNAGTLLQLGQTELEIKQTRSGPSSIIEFMGQELRFIPLTPLPKKAADLEKELLAREKPV
jgi:uncharacterized protein (DUF342 family)